MSGQRKIMIKCPRCKEESPFIIWSSINTTLNPEMKNAVRNRSAFLFECPRCGDKNYIDYGFLYHQMEDRIMIHYAQTDENAKEIRNFLLQNDPSGMSNELKENCYLLRIVRSQNELLEKLAILDEGLDDRIVELFKIYVLASVQEESQDCEAIEISFFSDNEKHFVQIVTDGQVFGTAEMQNEIYEKIQQQFAKHLSDTRSDELCIDRNWALKMMRLAREEN